MHPTYKSKLTIALLASMTASLAVAADRHQTYSELAGSSDQVLLGTVGAKSSHWGSDGRIYTGVSLYPDITIKGSDGAVTVQVLGGTVGDTTMSVSDGPELREGE